MGNQCNSGATVPCVTRHYHLRHRGLVGKGIGECLCDAPDCFFVSFSPVPIYFSLDGAGQKRQFDSQYIYLIIVATGKCVRRRR